MRNSNTSGILRITNSIMVLMMLVIILFSAFYISAETDHECSGEDCPICACIRQCENTLHGIGDGTAVSSAAAAPVILILPAAAAVMPAASQDTLISRKVRLND